MVEKKLFKTKLCDLYAKGRCPRDSCSFAHGNAELRRFSGSFNGRRDYRASDLRDKLGRGHSPQRRYSPGRDLRGRHALHGHKIQYDRGYSPSRSPIDSEKRHRRKQHLDGQRDISGTLRVSDGSDGIKERKALSSGAKYELEEQLKQAQVDVDTLDTQKRQLEIHLEKKDEEAENLLYKIENLETELKKEQEDCKRITSTIKKFIKVHNRHSKAQEELKRSQARLQKLGDQLAIDVRPNIHDEDLNINIVSDGDNEISPRTARKDQHSSKKRPRTSNEASEEAKQADRLNRNSTRSNGARTIMHEDTNNKRRKNETTQKVKSFEPGVLLPSTCMAAHADDEEIETDKIEENGRRQETSFQYLPPPPPLPPSLKNAYKKYEDEDVDVDVEHLDFDGDDEVDIE